MSYIASHFHHSAFRFFVVLLLCPSLLLVSLVTGCAEETGPFDEVGDDALQGQQLVVVRMGTDETSELFQRQVVDLQSGELVEEQLVETSREDLGEFDPDFSLTDDGLLLTSRLLGPRAETMASIEFEGEKVGKIWSFVGGQVAPANFAGTTIFPLGMDASGNPIAASFFQEGQTDNYELQVQRYRLESLVTTVWTLPSPTTGPDSIPASDWIALGVSPDGTTLRAIVREDSGQVAYELDLTTDDEPRQLSLQPAEGCSAPLLGLNGLRVTTNGFLVQSRCDGEILFSICSKNDNAFSCRKTPIRLLTRTIGPEPAFLLGTADVMVENEVGEPEETERPILWNANTAEVDLTFEEEAPELDATWTLLSDGTFVSARYELGAEGNADALVVEQFLVDDGERFTRELARIEGESGNLTLGQQSQRALLITAEPSPGGN